MAKLERLGFRDLTYSRWRRQPSMERFIDKGRVWKMTYCDLDAIDYCPCCCQPLLLIETARDVGQHYKDTRVLEALAKRVDLPAALVFYLPDEKEDIAQFRVRMIYPEPGPEKIMTPQEYAEWLWSFREAHRCGSDGVHKRY